MQDNYKEGVKMQWEIIFYIVISVALGNWIYNLSHSIIAVLLRKILGNKL